MWLIGHQSVVDSGWETISPTPESVPFSAVLPFPLQTGWHSLLSLAGLQWISGAQPSREIPRTKTESVRERERATRRAVLREQDDLPGAARFPAARTAAQTPHPWWKRPPQRPLCRCQSGPH